MGQATVDLPDPQRAPLPSVGADDLLAQMAGAEIDRLLAEADSGNPPLPPSSDPASIGDDELSIEAATAEETVFPLAPPSALPDNKTDVAIAAQRGAEPVRSDAQAESVPDATWTASASRMPLESDESLASELDSLLESLTTANTPPAEPTLLPPVQAVDAEEAAATPAVPAPAAMAVESAEILAAVEAHVAATGELPAGGAEETSAAERSALGAEPATADALHTETPAQEAYHSFQFLLKPLEWINAPIDACPDLLREFIGKAAILTAVNAVALICYVHFIRRH